MGLFAALVIIAVWFVPVDEGRLRQVPLSIPLSFEANRGQTDPSVRFLLRGRGSTLFLTPSEAVLVLKSREAGGVRREGAESNSGAPASAPNAQHSALARATGLPIDRKSTRLNSSHSQISYAVFCLKKKKSGSR